MSCLVKVFERIVSYACEAVPGTATLETQS
jgi:hypothetical protein